MRSAISPERSALQLSKLDKVGRETRNAIAAAVTARQHTQGMTEGMGEIVVPAGRWQAPSLSRN